MEIATPLILAIVAGAVATAVHSLITGGWDLRSFCGEWAALSIIAYVGLAGPFTIG